LRHNEGWTIKLLLAIDALTSSEDIVAAVVSRPWPSHTFAHVLTAIEYAAVPEKIWQDADGQFEPVKRTMLKRATEQTGQVADQLEKSGISVEAVIKIDEPRFVILREADEWPADLVLIRAHTYTNFSRWLLGSVSGAVLRDAPCSVEIVRTSTTSAELAAKNGLKILIGIDGSAFSLSAAQSVAARPWPSGTIVKLLSVEEPTTTGIVKGNPKEQIIRHAAEWGADLVVVGSHGRRGVKRWLLGSVSEAVARHAYCSVEVIRTHRAS